MLDPERNQNSVSGPGRAKIMSWILLALALLATLFFLFRGYQEYQTVKPGYRIDAAAGGKR